MPTPTPVALVLEDEREIRHFVRVSLQAEGGLVHEAGTVKHGLGEAATRRPDLIIADLGLPNGDGVDFIRQVRTWSAVPIIVLSARSHASLRHMRVGQAPADAVFSFGEVELDLAARIVRKRGVEVHLTPIEYRLLGVLAANAGRVMTHPHLLREVWGPGHSQSTHCLRVYMDNLRHKLEDDSAQPRYIVTETGGGDRLLAE